MARYEPARVPPEAPFALVLRTVRGLRLAAINDAAAEKGIRPGMALADARAALPTLSVASAAPRRDGRALERLARWCGRYGPARNVERHAGPADPTPATLPCEAGADDHGLWIDITGVAHLFAGEERLAGDLLARLASFGVTGRAGIADTHGAAFALARHATDARRPFRIAPPGETRSALAPLPVRGLRLDEETVLLLRRLGLAAIGDLYGLPRAALERRFRSVAPARGASATAARIAAGAALMHLDQALGLLGDPRPGLAEEPLFEARLALEEPLITGEAITGAIANLAEDLCRRLAEAGQGARRVVLTLYRTDGSLAEARIGTSMPCRAPAHIARLVGERLGAIDAGFGIDVATLAAPHVEPLAALAPDLAGTDAGLRQVGGAPLVDRLANRLGPARVFRLAAVASHIPELGERRMPSLGPPSPAAAFAASPVGPPRPPLLLARPEPVEVVAELPDGPPARLWWRRLARRIVRAEGPERIAPEWWRALPGGGPAGDVASGPAPALPPRLRDYYRLEDEAGARYWVFRAGRYGDEAEEAPQWFLHGIYA